MASDLPMQVALQFLKVVVGERGLFWRCDVGTGHSIWGPMQEKNLDLAWWCLAPPESTRRTTIRVHVLFFPTRGAIAFECRTGGERCSLAVLRVSCTKSRCLWQFGDVERKIFVAGECFACYDFSRKRNIDMAQVMANKAK